MIKFLILIILLIIIFILICLIIIRKKTESLTNYQRYQFNDYGEGTNWNLYLKQQPLNTVQEYTDNKKKKYKIIGDNSYQNEILIKTLSDFFSLEKNLFDEYQYDFDYITQKVSNNKCQFGIVEEPNLQLLFKDLSLKEENLIYNTKYNFVSRYPTYEKAPNIRYVCALYKKNLTFICKSKLGILSSYEINNMRIGCVKNSNDSKKLRIYLDAIDNTTSQMIEYDNLKILSKSFEDDNIDILFLCCAHPSPIVKKISKRNNIKIIDCLGDYNNKKILYFMPLMVKNSVNLSIYNNMGVVNLLAFRTILISNTRVSKWEIYNFLNNYFNNFNYINYKTNNIFIKELNAFFVYLTNNDVKYHQGSLLFFKKKGYIKYLSE